MTKYHEIVRHLQTRIAGGHIRPGNRLPPIRAIAGNFGCSPSTVVKAYDELERRHIIYPVGGSGYYLVENQLQAPARSREAIDFASASPGSETLPYQEFQHCLEQAVGIYKENLFSYSHPQGMDRLRKAIVRQLQDYQIFTDTEKLVVTTGSQQALSLLTAMPFPNGKTNILVEQPTYYGIIKALELSGRPALGIERTEQGLDLDALERIFRNGNIKFFYTIPRFHNPTGFSYPNAVKTALVELAEKYDVYLVEDDCLADLDTDRRADPLYALGSAGNIIYLKSYSKTVAPGLRLAAIVLPPELVNPFLEYKKWTDLTSPALSQAALEIFLTSGMYAKHRKAFAKIFRDRMACLKRVIAQNADPDIAWNVPETGFFACFTVHGAIPAGRVAPRVALDNIAVLNAESCFIRSHKRSDLFRISLGKTAEPLIQAGIPSIVRAIRELKSVSVPQRPFLLL